MEKGKETYRLPDGWIWTTIGEIAVLSSGGTPSRGNSSYFKGVIPWVKSGELNYNIITDTEEKITQEALDFSSAKIIPANALLIALYGSTVGKIARLGIEASTNQAIASIVTFSNFNQGFLYYYLFHNREKLLKKRKGGAQPNISQIILSNYSLPLPPFREQTIIVSKIESLFSELDQAEKGLQKAKQQLEVYRQALLKSAFEGRLTNKNIEYGKLPKDWSIVKVSDISNVVRGGSPRPAGDTRYYEGSIPFLKVKDITKDNKVVLNTYEYTIKEAGLKKTRRIKPKTLLLSNSGATLGVPKICMIDSTINDGIAAFLNLDERSVSYLYYYFLSITQQLRNINMGAAQPNLNTSIINNIEVAYCSFDEQNKVVEILESRFTLIENLEKSINNCLKEIILFKHSLLKKAFEGKLVNQVSNDESAELLLEKIKKKKEEYLRLQKELEKLKPKKKRKMEKKKTILEILKESEEPISTQELWTNSVHNGDIESFYSEIKDIYSMLSEVKENTESLLSLKK